MFSSTTKRGEREYSEETPAPRRPAAEPEPMASIIGAEMSITGDLSVRGDVNVEGTVEGNVESHSLTIGKRGRIDGTVVADKVRIAGAFEGDIKAGTVSLASTAHVVGDVHVRESLAIEPGAIFDGHVKRIKGDNVAKIGPEAEAKEPKEPAAGGADQPSSGKVAATR